MKKFFGLQSIDTDVAALILRLTFGGLFIYHRYEKLALFNEYSANFPDLIGIAQSCH